MKKGEYWKGDEDDGEVEVDADESDKKDDEISTVPEDDGEIAVEDEDVDKDEESNHIPNLDLFPRKPEVEQQRVEKILPLSSEWKVNVFRGTQNPSSPKIFRCRFCWNKGSIIWLNLACRGRALGYSQPGQWRKSWRPYLKDGEKPPLPK